jgi:HSP20 family protein
MRSLIETKRAAVPLWTNPFPFMRRLTEEMDRVFGMEPKFFGQAGAETAWAPAIEVFERDKKFVVRAELPGLAKEDVKVTIVHDGLTSYGSFYRQIALPEHVKAEEAKATFKNGVLEIEMPAIPMPEVKARALEIQG